MTRYIDSDKLIFQLRQNQMWTKSRDLTEAIITVQNQPTADVVEVKHGEWRDSEIDSMLSKCTLCGYPCGAYTLNYCPNCGAKMDGGKKE